MMKQKKLQSPKSQLSRKYPRCENCNSANVRFAFTAGENFRKCNDCNWRQCNDP